MPEPEPLAGGRYDDAVARLAAALEGRLHARRLSSGDLARYTGRQFTDGWRLKARFSDGDRDLDLLIDKDLPFSAPVVALAEPPPPLTWPHVEEDGVLCVMGGASGVGHRDPEGVAKVLLRDAYALVEDSIAGKTREDFLHEFLSYWNRALTGGARSFVSLLEARGPSRSVRVWSGSDRYILGEDDESLVSWLKNRYGGRKTYKTEAAGFLWLDRPLYPDEYPKKAADILAVARARAGDGESVLNSLAGESVGRVVVALGAPGEHGPSMAGLSVSSPTKMTAGGEFVSRLSDGFRGGTVPKSVLTVRFWQSTATAARSAVERADPAWIHGRGQDVRQPTLAASSVVVIGCGSVGADVAALLAQAGVGRILLIDPQTLTWANVGRHRLGAKYVGKSKALSLAEELRENYPHITAEAKFDGWENVVRAEPDLLGTFDLIVSATGDWGAESALNEWQTVSGRSRPIIYGWTEAHACAGHALLISAGGGCLECGFDSTGLPKLRVTEWPGGVQKQEPACGAVYQPYGPVELTHTINLIVELALDVLLGAARETIHRVWACRREFLETSGGRWTKEWLAKARAEGFCRVELPWPISPACEGCRTKAVAA